MALLMLTTGMLNSCLKIGKNIQTIHHCRWITRLDVEIDTAILLSTGFGLTISLIGFCFGVGLLVVGILDGKYSRILIAHILKNVTFMIMSIGFILKRFAGGLDISGPNFLVHIVLSVCFGILFPIFCSICVFKYYQYLQRREKFCKVLLELYKEKKLASKLKAKKKTK